jgi:hypothetical protein
MTVRSRRSRIRAGAGRVTRRSRRMGAPHTTAARKMRVALTLACLLALLSGCEPKKMSKDKAASMFSKMMKKKPAAATATATAATTTGELFDEAQALGVNAELLDAAMDSDDPKAALRGLIAKAEAGGRTGDGSTIGKLGESFKEKLPKEAKGPRTPKPVETAAWEPGVLELTPENFRAAVASARPVLVWVTTPLPPPDAKDPESMERRAYFRSMSRTMADAARRLGKDAGTLEKCSLAQFLVDSTESKEFAMELNVTIVPSLKLYRSEHEAEDAVDKIGQKPDTDELFDYMKEHVTGKDKLGRVKMGNYYFDHKRFQSKMEELGITNVKVGEDEEGKIKIDTTGAGSAGKAEL